MSLISTEPLSIHILQSELSLESDLELDCDLFESISSRFPLAAVFVLNELSRFPNKPSCANDDELWKKCEYFKIGFYDHTKIS
jgi:hypothetical protein